MTKLDNNKILQLKELRANGFGQEEIAQSLGVTQSLISFHLEKLKKQYQKELTKTQTKFGERYELIDGGWLNKKKVAIIKKGDRYIGACGFDIEEEFEELKYKIERPLPPKKLHYKVVEKLKNGAIIELERYYTIDFIYFASTGVDIGLEPPAAYTQKCLHTVPVKDESLKKIKIKIEVLEAKNESKGMFNNTNRRHEEVDELSCTKPRTRKI